MTKEEADAWFKRHDADMKTLKDDLDDELNRVYSNHMKRCANVLGNKNILSRRFAVSSTVDVLSPFLLALMQCEEPAGLATFKKRWALWFKPHVGA